MVNSCPVTMSSAIQPLTIQPFSHQPLAMSSYLLGDADHLHHLGDRVDTDNVRASEDRGGYGGGGSPIALQRGPIAQRPAQERFARRAHEHWPAEGGRKVSDVCEHTIAVRRLFGKPD